ncbi:MAG: hypothetical protein DMG57_08890 [Acidobacteria bacterium]|nr:MAG: hypothetical protein DMG57_08890 [Acidobacteriota bacterium]
MFSRTTPISGGYTSNAPSETMDAGAFGQHSTIDLRKAVSSHAGIRPDIQFWDDEYNSLPTLPNDMNELIQAKYVPRAIIYNWAFPTFLWELINDTSTSEGNNFGIIHGLMHHPEDFQPRPVFYTIARTNALFGDTRRDPAIEVTVVHRAPLQSATQAAFHAYGFRSHGGNNTGIQHPVLIDLDTDRISPLEESSSGTLRQIPVRDSVMAIADETYFDWNVLPEIPGPLRVEVHANAARLIWAGSGSGSHHRRATHGAPQRVGREQDVGSHRHQLRRH